MVDADNPDMSASHARTDADPAHGEVMAERETLYVLHHVHDLDRVYRSISMLGLFSSLANARAAIRVALELPGFRDAPEGFEITPVEIAGALSAGEAVLIRDNQVGQAALWMVETLLAGAVDCGCTPEQAVDLYRSIWYYTAGEILVRANRDRGQAPSGRPTRRDDRIRAADPDELPHLAALADRWASLTSRDTYDLGLRSLVNGFLLSLPDPKTRQEGDSQRQPRP
jgi:hypothetical protein